MKTGEQTPEADGGRPEVETEELRVHMHPILKEWLVRWSKAAAKRQRKAGEDVAQSGYSESIEHLLTEIATWTEEDLEGIRARGKVKSAKLYMYPENYDGGFPLPRRTESALFPEAGPGVGRGLGGVRLPKRRGKPMGPQETAADTRTDHAPRAVK